MKVLNCRYGTEASPPNSKAYPLNCTTSEGLEAYRQLYLEYNPRLKTRYVGLLLEILRYKFEGDLVTCIEDFERKVREYIDDETIIGVVILGVTDTSVKEHLVRHSGRLDKWSKMRKKSSRSPGQRST